MSLIRSAGVGDTFSVIDLLKSGTDPNIQDEHGDTALHYASNQRYIHVVKWLLEYGADPNIQDNVGHTTLHYVSMKGYTSIVQLLLEYGADPNMRSKNRSTALCSPL